MEKNTLELSSMVQKNQEMCSKASIKGEGYGNSIGTVMPVWV